MLSLNPSDVIAVTDNVKPYIIKGVIALVILLAVCILVQFVKRKPERMLARKFSLLGMIVAVVVTLNMIAQGPMIMLLTLISAQGEISEQSSTDASALCVEMAEEGIVLEQNDDGLLPLAAGKKLNVFGWGSVSPVYGGTGSGALSDAMAKVDLLTGLTDAGLELNTEISDFYTVYCEERPALGYGEHFWTLPEPTADSYTDELISNAKAFSDTAMIVISRIGGEFADLPTDMAVTRQEGSLEHYEDNTDAYQDFPDGTHYLSLSQTEKDMVDLVCSNFDNVILVYNSANTLELGFVDDYAQIKSVIWCPGPGQTGFEALGEIVTGAVNPSAKATDTFVYDLTKAPWFNNFGTFTYTNADEFSYENTGTFTYGTTTPHFVNYVDGIYVGYKFYETAAADGVINYEEYVQYPFGHGLSYTTFEQKMGDIKTGSDGSISFDVTVTNTGNVAGKDVVEVFYNPPYTNGGIEKSAANLVAFDKTQLLEPGASETVTITFNQDDMASFDTYGNGCYVLEQGDYIISINADSHTVLDSRTYTVASDIVYNESNPRNGDEQAAVTSFTFAEGDASFLSRADGFKNLSEVTAAPTDFTMSDEIKATFYNTGNWNHEDFNNAQDVMPTTGANNGVKLEELRGLDFDDEKWETLLDELTVEDMEKMIALGGYGTLSINHIGKSATNDNDGPANITNNFTGGASIGFPSEVIIASTWNQELVERFGESIGTMADELDVSGWYAPGMDSHRSAFDGRNFEYYSEDGVLAGMIGAAAVRGAQSKGLYAYMKHFVLNDQQQAQAEMLCTWVSEQALREVFLKPFEIAVKEADCHAVMAAWNYIGNRWCGACDTLMTTVLRDEWGFTGLAISDGYHYWGYMDADQAIRAGTDLMLKNYDVPTNHVTDTTSATGVLAMRRASKDILYTVVNSREYAPENLDTGMLKWQKILLAVNVITGLLVVILGALSVRTYLRKKKEER